MKPLSVIAGLAVIVFAGVQPVRSQDISAADNSGYIHVDQMYAQFLHFKASADDAITPSRFLYWLRSLHGNSILYKPSNTDFAPLIDTHDNQLLVVARIRIHF